MQTLQNQYLHIEVSPLGAELQSIRTPDGTEYLHQGDERYWSRRSPILFPILGGLYKKQYRHKGQTYVMKNHGFAMNQAFVLSRRTETQLVYTLHESDETLSQYPFPFRLEAGYELQDNKVVVAWEVENTGKHELYFQIGGHPALLVPEWKEGTPLHARMAFDHSDPQTLHISSSGLLLPGHHDAGVRKGILEVDSHTFDIDTLIFDCSQVSSVTLLRKDGTPHVSLHTHAPVMALWSPPGKDAPFICVEPWYGVCDWEEYTGELADKHLSNRLLPGGVFKASYTIVVGE